MKKTTAGSVIFGFFAALLYILFGYSLSRFLWAGDVIAKYEAGLQSVNLSNDVAAMFGADISQFTQMGTDVLKDYYQNYYDIRDGALSIMVIVVVVLVLMYVLRAIFGKRKVKKASEKQEPLDSIT